MFNERVLKEAFEKVKLDIFSLGNELSALKSELIEIKSAISAINDSIDKLKIQSFTPKYNDAPVFSPTNYPTDSPTQPLDIPTHSNTPTHNPTVPVEVGGLKYQNFDTWSGNVGVPTDRQTNQQTDIPTDFTEEKSFSDTSANFHQSESLRHYNNTSSSEVLPKKSLHQQIKDASEIIESLDDIKKEIRLKIKTMTAQEVMVFSTIYQLEEQFPEGVEYRQIATKLKLSESSIRDYTQKLISKGIPVEKLKLNNKKILLRISPELKNIAPLSTILRLREL